MSCATSNLAKSGSNGFQFFNGLKGLATRVLTTNIIKGYEGNCHGFPVCLKQANRSQRPSFPTNELSLKTPLPSLLTGPAPTSKCGAISIISFINFPVSLVLGDGCYISSSQLYPKETQTWHSDITNFTAKTGTPSVKCRLPCRVPLWMESLVKESRDIKRHLPSKIWIKYKSQLLTNFA